MTSAEKMMMDLFEASPEFKRLWIEYEVESSLMAPVMVGRNDLHMTQEELAKAAGVPVELIEEIESCFGNPTVEQLKSIAKVLGKKIEIKFV